MLTVPLIVLPWLLRDRWSRFAILTCGVLAVGLFIEPWMHPHYAAPVTCLVVMLGSSRYGIYPLVVARPAGGAMTRIFDSGCRRASFIVASGATDTK